MTRPGFSLRLHLVSFLMAACASVPHMGGPVSTPQGVQFSLHAPSSAHSVQVIGTWEGNAWGGFGESTHRLDRTRGVLRDSDGDGIWTGTFVVPPGRHHYRFLINGTVWLLDPTNPETSPWHGGVASRLVVGVAGSVD